MQHHSGIPEKIVAKVMARRGRLHAFERIEARRTAIAILAGTAETHPSAALPLCT